MVPLIGYLDRFSARPGEALAVQVSSTLDGPYAADLVRVRHADPNPAGPGMKLIPVPVAFAGEYPSRAQAVPLGSSGQAAGQLALGEAFTVLLRVMPWRLKGEQVVFALEAGLRRLVVALHGDRFGVSVDGVAVRLDADLVVRRWYELAVTVAPGILQLSQRPLVPAWGVEESGTASLALPEAAWPEELRVTFAALPDGAAPGGFAQHYNGRIEDPVILAGAAPASLEAPEALAATGRLLAWWDFSECIDGDALVDRGPAALHGVLRNLPVRAVCGSRWTGAEHSWRHAPRHYAAIHFHADDLEDCRWQTDFRFEVPAGMPSGLYAVRLRHGAHWDMIPFHVLPPRGVAHAAVAFLAATFTHQVYANYRRIALPPEQLEKREAWGAFPWCGNLTKEFGLSTYNAHPDGSGISFSSRLRPIFNIRPGFLAVPDGKGSGLRHLPADTHLTDWLEEKGIAYDVITDEDLDEEGLPLLARYKCVLTSSHPEYHTQTTLDSLQAYVSGGGRLAYLGGNGFYWKVARQKHRPHVLEIRRAEGGIRAWAAEPGEYFMQLDGTLGGLWRRNGRPPQALAGVGFSGQGMFEGSHYRRMPGAADPRVAWIMDGVEMDAPGGETFGGYGLSGGGAAGFELDRADPLLGTPPNAVILARSEGHQDHFVTVPEELLTHTTTVTGEKPEDLIRAEIVYFDTAKGGAVFATGSITFCGSLSHNGYSNGISRMLENVVRRFSD